MIATGLLALAVAAARSASVFQSRLAFAAATSREIQRRT